MNLKEIRELIEFLKEQDIAEFELERGDVKVRIKRGAETVPSQETRYVTVPTAVPAASAAPGEAPVAAALVTSPPATDKDKTPKEALPEEGLHLVKSPIVGTFYESPSPGAPPFVKPGDKVTLGQVICIVEAMKLMNEIESDVSGEVLRVFVDNGQPVEYGQPLFGIRPSRKK
jgi:acetyl-CoA carboxylase biotin carboxyl carrier protein